VTDARVTEPARATRSPVGFLVLGGIALAALVAHIVGGLNFPPNAPVEQIICFGLVVDTVAVVIIAVIGFLVARQSLTEAPSSKLSVAGLVMGAIALGAVIAAAWVPSIAALLDGNLLHYSDETFPAFALAPVWVTGLAFSAFSYRRGGDARNNLFSLLGLGFGITILVAAAVASALYGLGLTT
jgi:hypothetical protein